MASVVRSPTETFSQNHLLRHFAPSNRHLFPVQVRVLDCDDQVTVLANHQVEAGSQLVLHGWTRQPKVLATCGQRRYAIPLSYQGTFRVIPRTFRGLTGLEHSFQKGQKLRVIEANPDQKDGVLPVREGDVIQVLGESVQDQKGASYMGCQKVDERTGRTSDVFLSSTWDIAFEEVIDYLPAAGEDGPGLFAIRDFVSAIAENSLDVELVQPGPDHLDPNTDLPMNTPVNLCKHVIEPAVYASLALPQAPAFHLPMRAPIYVRFLRQLPRGCSPLLTKQNARISTLDRCVEMLSADIFQEIVVNHRHFLQIFQTTPKVMTFSPGSLNWKRGLSSSQSQIDPQDVPILRKGPASTTGSLGGRMKWKFGLKRKTNRSTSGSRAGSDVGSIRSLPVTSGKKTSRFQWLVSSGDLLDTSSTTRNDSNSGLFLFPQANRKTPQRSSLRSVNSNSKTKQKVGFQTKRTTVPTVVAGLSKKQPSNQNLAKSTIYEEVGYEDSDTQDEEIAIPVISTAKIEPVPRNQSPKRDQQIQTETKVKIGREGSANQNSDKTIQANVVQQNKSNGVAGQKSPTNQKTPTDTRVIQANNHISASDSNTKESKGNLTAANHNTPSDSNRTNHSNDRNVSTNQTTGTVTGNGQLKERSTKTKQAPIIRSENSKPKQEPSIRPENSMSSDAKTSSISDDVSSNTSSSIRQPANGPSGGSILKTNSNFDHQTPQQQQPNPVASPSFQIPPGFALVPLNPEQSAIPPGYAIVPAKEVQPQRPQQQPAQHQQLLQQPQIQMNTTSQIQNSQHPPSQEMKTNGIASRKKALLTDSNDNEVYDTDNIQSDSDALEMASDIASYYSNDGILIPVDGNLYSFSAKKFSQFLACLNVDDSVVRSCKKHRIDGKRFSRMTDQDLEQRGLLQPIIIYFRKRTFRRVQNPVY